MNKKKTIGGLLSLVGLAGLVYYFRRQFKKEKAKLEEKKQKEDEELSDLGISPKKLEEECEDEGDKNLVKALAVSTIFNPNWDIDIVDPDISVDEDYVISVTQENNQLVFVFDIPNYLKGGYRSPKLGDYISAINAKTESIWEETVKFCPRPRRKLVGAILAKCKLGDKEYSECVEIDKSVYEELADGDDKHQGNRHDGLGTFYEKVCKHQLPESVEQKLQDWVDKRWESLLEKGGEVELKHICLLYKVSFMIQNSNGIGISLKTALDALDRYVNELCIEKKKNFGDYENYCVDYRHVLFCAPNDEGKFDLTWYYGLKDNSLYVTSFTYTNKMN